MFYEWEKGNESSFFSMLGLIQTTVVSNLPMHRAAMKCISPVFFFTLLLCASLPHSLLITGPHTGLMTHADLIAIWIEFRVKSKIMKSVA